MKNMRKKPKQVLFFVIFLRTIDRRVLYVIVIIISQFTKHDQYYK